MHIPWYLFILLTNLQLIPRHIPTRRTQPFTLGLLRHAHTIIMKPLKLAIIIVASHHVAETDLLT